MLTVLTGDIISVGDLVIVDRGISLLKYFYPSEKIVKLNRWEPLNENLEIVNNSRAIILLGGPAIVENIYPGIYPLVENLNKIKVPIIGMGLGSSIKSYNIFKERTFKFNDRSEELLNRLAHDHHSFSVRDYITERILKKNKIDNVFVTACPAWFDVTNIAMPIKITEIETLGFATGVGHFYSNESFDQQIEVMKKLQIKYKGVERYCIFQDSLEKDNKKPQRIISKQKKLAKAATDLGYKIIDATNNLGLLRSTLSNLGLLVSYRVHAHVSMLTQGRPSILIAEDSRGVGFTNLMGLRLLNSFDENNNWISDKICFKNPFISRINNRFKLYPPKINKALPQEVINYIDELILTSFNDYYYVSSRIQFYYKRMSAFISNLPK